MLFNFEYIMSVNIIKCINVFFILWFSLLVSVTTDTVWCVSVVAISRTGHSGAEVCNRTSSVYVCVIVIGHMSAEFVLLVFSCGQWSCTTVWQLLLLSCACPSDICNSSLWLFNVVGYVSTANTTPDTSKCCVLTVHYHTFIPSEGGGRGVECGWPKPPSLTQGHSLGPMRVYRYIVYLCHISAKVVWIWSHFHALYMIVWLSWVFRSGCSTIQYNTNRIVL